MHLGTPLQLVREKTMLITKQSGDQQDPATKAWNFATALYYKGNRTIPWRLVEDNAKEALSALKRDKIRIIDDYYLLRLPHTRTITARADSYKARERRLT